MQLYLRPADLKLALPTALTIGVFDGVHRGHRALFEQVVNCARSLEGVSAALTFDPHPDAVLRPEQPRKLLCSVEERIRLIGLCGIEHLVVLPFDPAMARTSAEQFMQSLCSHIPLRELWIGHDFRLGYRGLGTFTVLQTLGEQLGYTTHAIPAALVEGEPVSSTRLRQQLLAGEVEAAAHGLGRYFTLTGRVVQGDQRGRTIGFPTANIEIQSGLLLPADGVYACWAQLDNDPTLLPAVTNIGVRPTFGVLAHSVETHLLHWQGDLYGHTLHVHFVARLRGEQRFSGIDALVAQIRQDAARAEQLLQAEPPRPIP